MLFGPKSEKFASLSNNEESQKDSSVEKDEKEADSLSEKAEFQENRESQTTDAQSIEKHKAKGHGRRAGSDYFGAKVVVCSNEDLKAGQGCPSSFCKGHLYDTKEPSVFIQLVGQPIVGATRFEQEVLRCSTCQTRYTARLPKEVRPRKYLESADAAIVLAKYSAGLPFYRMKRLQAEFGVPLSESVQFERCERVSDALLPVYLQLKKMAAQGEVLYADDTRVKILSLIKENKNLSSSERRGMQTTALVVQTQKRRIVLYESGRRHAGENAAHLLEQRGEGLPPPIQMSDALSSNWSSASFVIAAKCLAHARRQFVEIREQFPSECGYVLEAIAEVYRVESETAGMSASERLFFHKEKSGARMAQLKVWLEEKFEQRLVEPNGSLGKAFNYMLNHWEGLTRFLSEEGCPIDNNLCERALKVVVLNRKNSLFYKTENGAAISDILLSVIETCRINGVSAFDYMSHVLKSERGARSEPINWLPWNYKRESDRMKSYQRKVVQPIAA